MNPERILSSAKNAGIYISSFVVVIVLISQFNFDLILSEITPVKVSIVAAIAACFSAAYLFIEVRIRNRELAYLLNEISKFPDNYPIKISAKDPICSIKIGCLHEMGATSKIYLSHRRSYKFNQFHRPEYDYLSESEFNYFDEIDNGGIIENIEFYEKYQVLGDPIYLIAFFDELTLKFFLKIARDRENCSLVNGIIYLGANYVIKNARNLDFLSLVNYISNRHPILNGAQNLAVLKLEESIVDIVFNFHEIVPEDKLDGFINRYISNHDLSFDEQFQLSEIKRSGQKKMLLSLLRDSNEVGRDEIKDVIDRLTSLHQINSNDIEFLFQNSSKLSHEILKHAVRLNIEYKATETRADFIANEFIDAHSINKEDCIALLNLLEKASTTHAVVVIKRIVFYQLRNHLYKEDSTILRRCLNLCKKYNPEIDFLQSILEYKLLDEDRLFIKELIDSIKERSSKYAGMISIVDGDGGLSAIDEDGGLSVPDEM